MRFQRNDVTIAVIIPAYRAAKHIIKVITGIPEFVSHIIVVDDCSPDNTAELVVELKEPRVSLIRHKQNQGVGGAMLSGYEAAINLGADILVKMDSDDQMDPDYIEDLIHPILSNQADYTKGNRFLHDSGLSWMPLGRRIGNVGLSFLTKIYSGYWNIFDPTNGFTAIHAFLAKKLNKTRIHKRYFFETSMLLELRLMQAVVVDVYMPARYGNEPSSLSELNSLLGFPPLLLRGFMKRIIIEYFIRDFSAVSILILCGIPLILFGLSFGAYHWIVSILNNLPATTGTVMLATLPFILGFQLILQALLMDIQNVPTRPIHRD